MFASTEIFSCKDIYYPCTYARAKYPVSCAEKDDFALLEKKRDELNCKKKRDELSCEQKKINLHYAHRILPEKIASRPGSLPDRSE